MKFFCEQCKAKYQIADDKVAGKTVRMKCRKCGHIIELRAEVTESSVIAGLASMTATSIRTPAPGATSEGAPPRPALKPPARPPPKPNALATSLTSTKPAAPKPERLPGGALAGAFKSNVQHHEEEGSAPFDMADLAPGDDWYVAVNGVPVGPIRVAEVRRKAALGAVTEDSLVWQEGLDEWRPLKSFPDLAANVREAAASGRISMTPPPPDARHSSPPAAPRSPSMRTGTTSGVPSRVTSSRPLQPNHSLHASPPAAARSNVVPFTSRLATAERLEEPTEIGALQALTADARPAAVAVADPFALQPHAALAPPPAAAPASLAPPSVAAQRKKDPPWVIIGMLAAFVAFGTVGGIALFFRPQPTQQVIVQAPPATAAAVTAAPVAPVVVASAEPTATVSAPTAPAQGGRGPATRATASAAAPGRSLDLHSLTQGTSVAPGEEPGGESAPAPGQCLSGGQVQQVIQLHQLALRRACWERNPTTKPTVNVAVQLTVGPDGSAQGVSTSGDEPSVTKCIETDVRGWHFPAMGCSQKTGFSFKFVRQ